MLGWCEIVCFLFFVHSNRFVYLNTVAFHRHEGKVKNYCLIRSMLKLSWTFLVRYSSNIIYLLLQWFAFMQYFVKLKFKLRCWHCFVLFETFFLSNIISVRSNHLNGASINSLHPFKKYLSLTFSSLHLLIWPFGSWRKNF